MRQPDLLQRVRSQLARFLPETRPLHLCVGFSGGLDSVVLLHLLARLRADACFHLSVIHVHHGLSPHADAWAAFVRDFAAAQDVACQIVRVEVDRAARSGPEGAARTARYAAFTAAPGEWLLLAHHGNDQAETLLFNLLRGGGVAGLAAMPVYREHQGKKLLRPLLQEPRAELEAYAQAHRLRWVEDESNQSLAFSRNHLRHQIVPALQIRYPAVVPALVRTARHLAEADELLDELARMDLALCAAQGCFDLSLVQSLTPVRQRHALRYWLQQGGVVLEERAFAELHATMLNAGEGAMPVLVWRQRAVRRYRQQLFITPASCVVGPEMPCLLTPGGNEIPAWQGSLILRAEGVLDPRCLLERTELRPWLGSEMLCLRAGRHRRSLKHLCQEFGIPPWVRESTPLLYVNDQLAAMPGLGVDVAFQAQEGRTGFDLFWQRAK